jgi:hypothetical protein
MILCHGILSHRETVGGFEVPSKPPLKPDNSIIRINHISWTMEMMLTSIMSLSMRKTTIHGIVESSKTFKDAFQIKNQIIE